MVRNDFLSVTLIALCAAPAAQALCPASNKTQTVLVRLAGCANAPKEFVVKINGSEKTVTRPDANKAEWKVTMDQPFCISEATLTPVDVPGFRTACEVKARREGPATAPLAIFEVPCAPLWQLTVVKNKAGESKFTYRVNRDPVLACGDRANAVETVAPDSVGDISLRDNVVVSVKTRKGDPLEVTVKEQFLRSRPAGAPFGLLFRNSPARNEQTDQVRDAYADKVDLIFKKEGSK